MTVLSTTSSKNLHSRSKGCTSPTKGGNPVKNKKNVSSALNTCRKRKFCALATSGNTERDRPSKNKCMVHPQRPVGEPWPIQELRAFDPPQDPVLREVLKSRGWMQSSDPRPGTHGPQTGVRSFFAKQCNPNSYARTTARPNYALWFLGKAAPSDSGVASIVREKEESVKIVVDYGEKIVGKSGNYRLAKFPGTEALLSKFHLAAAFQNKPWYPDSFILPRDRTAALQEIRSKWDARNNFWVGTSHTEATSGMCIWHGADPKLARMVRESDWYPRSIVHQHIANPLLIGGHKFHMHINLVITNLSPLEAFVHENGQCLFAGSPFTLSSASLGENFDADAHIVKRGLNTKPEALDNYFKNVNGQQIRMRQLATYLTENHPSFTKQMLWRQILEIATEAASYISQGILKHNSVTRDRHFEIFGMDLLLDRDLKVWMCDLSTDENLGYPNKEMPVATDPDFTEDVKAYGDIYHDLFALLGLDASRRQNQGSLSHWLKIELP